MARKINRLTEFGVLDAINRTGKTYYCSDGNNLYLRVTTADTKSWVFRFSLHGKAREMGLGRYPDVSLFRARSQAKKAKACLARGEDPIVLKRIGKTKKKVCPTCRRSLKIPDEVFK